MSTTRLRQPLEQHPAPAFTLWWRVARDGARAPDQLSGPGARLRLMSLEDAFTVAAVTLLATAALTDLAWRRIPNALCLALTGLGLLRLGFDASGWLLPAADLGVAFILLGLGMVAFHYGVFGGGDTKLVAATSLWLGHAQTGSFLFIMALAGGLLALAWLLWRRLTRYPDGQSATLPYGIAIAVAGIAVTLLN